MCLKQSSKSSGVNACEVLAQEHQEPTNNNETYSEAGMDHCRSVILPSAVGTDENVYELQESLPSLPIKTKLSAVDDESDYSEPEGLCPPHGLERVVIGADSVTDLSLEESDNMANELLYQDVSHVKLQTKDFHTGPGLYTGVWEMRSGVGRGANIPVNEVKPYHRPDNINFKDTCGSTFDTSPPGFDPPPLPEHYNVKNIAETQILSPTIKTLPIAPMTPAQLNSVKEGNPPIIPPRSTTVKPAEQVHTDLQHSRNSNNLLSNTTLDFDYGDKDKEKCVMRPIRAPAPPPKVANPFKDYYDQSRGTYNFDSDITGIF